MMRVLLCSLCVVFVLYAETPAVDFSDDAKIAVHNFILAQVNGQTISMIDVKKKMDLLFHRAYPQLEASGHARCQFYEEQWRHVLTEIIDQQLILADALDKEVKLSDGEIREEMEKRFGPNIISTLDAIGLTFEETWKIVKEELFVQRMTWWFIHNKAIAQVTPQNIRQAFHRYLRDNPPYREYRYRVITLRGEWDKEIHARLVENGTPPELLFDALKAIDASVQMSLEFTAKDVDLSQAHKEALAVLSPGEYGDIQYQANRRDPHVVAKIFYLYEHTDHPAPLFETLSHQLRDELVQKAIVQESNTYLEKLRKHYGFDPSHLKERVPDDLHPFSLQ